MQRVVSCRAVRYEPPAAYAACSVSCGTNRLQHMQRAACRAVRTACSVQRVVRYEPPAAYADPHYAVSITVWPVAGLLPGRNRFEPRHIYDRLMAGSVGLGKEKI